MLNTKTLYVIFKLPPKLYKNTRHRVYLAIIIINNNTTSCRNRIYHLASILRSMHISSFYFTFNILQFIYLSQHEITN
jgi:hypothetical protein